MRAFHYIMTGKMLVLVDAQLLDVPESPYENRYRNYIVKQKMFQDVYKK